MAVCSISYEACASPYAYWYCSDAATILQAGFLDYIRVDATNEDTKNNLDDR
jgi:hypothetical protein